MCATVLPFFVYFYDFLAAIYTVYTSPNHPSVPNHLPTLIVTPHGMVSHGFCEHTVHSDTLLDRQGNLQISSIRISTRTSYASASKRIPEPRSDHPLRNRTRRTTCSHPPRRAIYVLLSSSRPAALVTENPPHRILAILLEVPGLFVAKHLEISNGPSPTLVSFRLFTNFPSPLRTHQISPCSKSPSRTRMPRSGVCSISLTRDTTSPLSGLNSERSRRIHLHPMEPEEAEPGSVSLGKPLKKRQYGRHLAKATRIVWSG